MDFFMDALFSLFLSSLSAAIKASPKRLWRRIKAHFVSRAWYHGPKKNYYFQVGSGNFVPLTEDALKQEVILRGLGYVPALKPSAAEKLKKYAPASQANKDKKQQEKNELNRKLAEFLSAVRETRRVDWVGELAGHFPGPTTINNTPCLILRGPALIEPHKSDHLPVYNIIHSLLSETPEQEDYFLAAFQRAVRLVYQGHYEPQQSWFFAGNPDDGKTLLTTEILSACLGGRRIDATSYFIGATRFNADLARCELWIVDDMGDAKGFDRLVYNNNLKKIAADPDIRVEPKGIDALNARHLFHVVVVLFNLEGRGGSHLVPEIAEDNKGKFLIFRTTRADLPTGPDQYRTIQKQIRAALPAFQDWLLNVYSPNPAVLSDDRFQIRPYHHPDVLARIQETGNATQILPIIDQWMLEVKIDEWFGPPMRLYQLLLNDQAGTSKIVSSMFKSVLSFGRALSDLAHRLPDRFFKLHTKTGPVYRILSEQKGKEVAEGISSVNATAPTPNVVDAKFNR
jgi:hypothetical protein